MSKKISAYLILIVFVAAIGGLLFGYNTSIIAGAILFIKDEFSLSNAAQSGIVTVALIGALIGSSCGGLFADRLGRRLPIIMTSLLFIFSAIFLSVASSVLGILMGRILTGFAIGVGSVVVPLYIAEMAPARSRGALVALNQLAITLGILISYFVSFESASSENWRILFGLALIPALGQFIGMLFLPETPSFLIKQNRNSEALKVLNRTAPGESHAMQKTEASAKRDQKLKWADIFKPIYRTALVVGIGVSLFQQITGINAVIYYAPQIFQLAGLASKKAALLATVGVGSVNVLATIVSLFLLDRMGRRKLLLVGLIGMIASLCALSLSFFASLPFISFIAVISLMVYVISFAISLGPVTWVLISEIYPLQIRGRAMSVATLVNWAANCLVSLSFLPLVDMMGKAGVFLLYALIGLIAYFFVYRRVPETKGKTLDEIELFWKK